MKLEARLNRKIAAGRIRLAAEMLLAIAAAFGSFAAPARAQSDGHSFLRMEIAGRPITNLVLNQKHAGWLQVEGVRAIVASREVVPGDATHKTKTADDRWSNLSVILRSGHARAGKIRFGAGDDGGLEPLIDAQEHKSLLASADLDLYDESSGAFIGKYRLKGIRVLSLEDVKASACAMYEITMSFQSVEKMKR
jgi:hypothetical protein